MRSVTSLMVRWVLGLILVLATFVAAATAAGFPPAGIDQIDHDLIVDIYTVAPDGGNQDKLETLNFSGRMLITRSDPYVNEDGFRQADFVVTSWRATAWSNALNSLVEYRMSEAVPQLTSTIVSQQQGSDFPVTFNINLFFNALVDGAMVFPDFPGCPRLEDVSVIPPNGNRTQTPATSSFESRRIEFDHPGLGTVRFVPQSCADQASETLVTFTEEQKQTLNLSFGAAATEDAPPPCLKDIIEDLPPIVKSAGPAPAAGTASGPGE